MNAEKINLQLAAALLAVGKLSTDQAIAAADAALQRGIYSDGLALVTAAEPVWSEVGPLFERALAENNIAVPTRTSALKYIACEHARQIVAGEVTPCQGARRIWWDVAIEPDADPSLLSFVGMASECEDAPDYRSEYDADIVNEARRLLNSSEGG